MSLSNVSSQCPISSPLTLPLDSCCRTIACFFCSNVWKYISAICIIRSLHCSFYRKLSVCSFQGTNCDNHSIMVIYGLKWLFLHIESYPFTLWAQVDSNHRPHAYQACALTSWAMRPKPILLTKRLCRLHDLNTRPSDYKSDALPTELSRQLLI